MNDSYLSGGENFKYSTQPVGGDLGFLPMLMTALAPRLLTAVAPRLLSMVRAAPVIRTAMRMGMKPNFRLPTDMIQRAQQTLASGGSPADIAKSVLQSVGPQSGSQTVDYNPEEPQIAGVLGQLFDALSGSDILQGENDDLKGEFEQLSGAIGFLPLVSAIAQGARFLAPRIIPYASRAFNTLAKGSSIYNAGAAISNLLAPNSPVSRQFNANPVPNIMPSNQNSFPNFVNPPIFPNNQSSSNFQNQGNFQSADSLPSITPNFSAGNSGLSSPYIVDDILRADETLRRRGHRRAVRYSRRYARPRTVIKYVYKKRRGRK